MAGEPYTVEDYDRWIRRAKKAVLLQSAGNAGSHVKYELPGGDIIPGLDPFNKGKLKHNISVEFADEIARCLGIDRRQLRAEVLAFHGRNAGSSNRRTGKASAVAAPPPPPAAMSLAESFAALKKIEKRIPNASGARLRGAEKRLFQVMRDAELIANELLNVSE